MLLAFRETDALKRTELNPINIQRLIMSIKVLGNPVITVLSK